MSSKIVEPLRMIGSRSLVIKAHLVAALGEFVGTTLFLFFALAGTHVANLPANSITGQITGGLNGSSAATANTSSLLYIAFAFGMSLTVTAWCMSRVSGSLYNPAVSLGMVLVGAMSPLRAAILTLMQFLGGLSAAGLVSCMTPGQANVRTTLAPGMSTARGLFLEAACTALLMLVILLVAAEKHIGNFIAPLPIGLALFVAELASVSFTGGSLNPARSLGPNVIALSFNGYDWIYFLGPALGAAVAAGFYRLLKYLEFVTTPEPLTNLGEKKPGAPEQLPGAEGDAPAKREKKAHKVERTGLGGGLLTGPEDEQGAVGGLSAADAREMKERLVRIERMLMASGVPLKQTISPGMSDGQAPSDYYDQLSYHRV
ncbi:hypothetical protein BMF94_4506 [Rhodotorula taiwanensis]|uniref:Aquaporin n=1 Tax=Rhodotorula taiwanensis TaxID=741276 RepID=A0A2S5B7D4_9BASI|nr:hypothetical protein BMF94_4506 [Rhodotorula taiwanensis]